MQTICRHACFGVLRLISAAWYTSTYVAALHLYTCSCSHQAHAVQHNTTNTCGHAQSVIGPECSNDLKGSGLCIIAFRHLLRSARVLNNTEVKGHYSTICRHACFGVLRLISAAWYTSTYVAALHLYIYIYIYIYIHTLNLGSIYEYRCYHY